MSQGNEYTDKRPLLVEAATALRFTFVGWNKTNGVSCFFRSRKLTKKPEPWRGQAPVSSASEHDFRPKSCLLAGDGGYRTIFGVVGLNDASAIVTERIVDTVVIEVAEVSVFFVCNTEIFLEYSQIHK